MATKKAKRPRMPSLEVRLSQADKDRIKYYADAENLSASEWLVAAADHYIRWKQSDYDLPTAEIQRLNQIIDVLSGLIDRQRSLEETVVEGFNTTMGLMDSSHNYLIDEHTHPDRSSSRLRSMHETHAAGEDEGGRSV